MACRVPISNRNQWTDFPTTNPDCREDSVRMANELRTEVEQVKKQEDVKRALKQTSTVKAEEAPKAETKDKLVLTTHLIVLIALALVRYVLQLSLFGFAAKHPTLLDLFLRIDRSAMGVVVALIIAKIGDVYLIGRIDSPVSRYNLRRVAKLGLGLLLAFIVISGIFQNWYTTIVSIGLFSLILGLAVQTPMTSFLGWITFWCGRRIASAIAS